MARKGKTEPENISGYFRKIFAENPKLLKSRSQKLLSLKGPPLGLFSVAYSPDGKRIVTAAGEDNALTVWDAETGQEILSIKPAKDRTRIMQTGIGMAYSPDGKRIVAGSWENTLKVWNVEKGQ